MSGPYNRGKGKALAFLRSLVGHVGDECVSWPFSINPVYGYGQLGCNGRSATAPGLMCELAHGDRPTSKHRARSCQKSKSCVNPNHLTWALHSQCMKKKSQPGNGRSWKLTPQQIEEIRALKSAATLQTTATQFGVSIYAIRWWQGTREKRGVITTPRCLLYPAGYMSRKSRPALLRPTPLMAYPFIRAARVDHADLLAVNALVPRGLPGREDVCQELLLAILEGRIGLDQLRERGAVGSFITAFKRGNFEASGNSVSLDMPRLGGGSWYDFLATPAAEEGSGR